VPGAAKSLDSSWQIYGGVVFSESDSILPGQETTHILAISMKGDKLLGYLVEQLDGYRLEDVEVVDIRRKSSLASYLLIATGRSEKHIEATMEQIRLALKERELPARPPEGRNSGWIVLDLGDLIVNLFTEEERRKYDLAHLWKEEIGNVQL
jgi:ribosome-associated protein